MKGMGMPMFEVREGCSSSEERGGGEELGREQQGRARGREVQTKAPRNPSLSRVLLRVGGWLAWLPLTLHSSPLPPLTHPGLPTLLPI